MRKLGCPGVQVEQRPGDVAGVLQPRLLGQLQQRESSGRWAANAHCGTAASSSSSSARVVLVVVHANANALHLAFCVCRALGLR